MVQHHCVTLQLPTLSMAREAFDPKATGEGLQNIGSFFNHSFFTWFSFKCAWGKTLGKEALRTTAITASREGKFRQVVSFTFTYWVAMTLSFQDKKENTFAPAAAGPRGLQTQRHDAGVTA